MNIAVQTVPAAASAAGFRDHKVTARDCSVYYGEKHALKNMSIDIPDRGVTSFIGPSGCGKSTFLRCINRMNDTIPGCRVTGLINIDNQDIYDKSLDVLVLLRARVGMVFQKAQSVPEVDLRKRGLRSAHPRPCSFQGRTR